MAKISKKRSAMLKNFDFSAEYSLKEAVELLKKSHTAKFNSSVDIAVCLNIDPKKSDQIVRGSVLLPHGRGKVVRVLVLCGADKSREASDAGADYVGGEDYIAKIEAGWLDIDVIVTIPSMMALIAKRIGKILGPKGLMPTPKNGTVTDNLSDIIKEIKAGKIDVRADKYGIVHASIGRASFVNDQIEANFLETMQVINRLKPVVAKSPYIKSIHLSTTMGKGVKVDKSSVLK